MTEAIYSSLEDKLRRVSAFNRKALPNNPIQKGIGIIKGLSAQSHMASSEHLISPEEIDPLLLRIGNIRNYVLENGVPSTDYLTDPEICEESDVILKVDEYEIIASSNLQNPNSILLSIGGIVRQGLNVFASFGTNSNFELHVQYSSRNGVELQYRVQRDLSKMTDEEGEIIRDFLGKTEAELGI